MGKCHSSIILEQADPLTAFLNATLIPYESCIFRILLLNAHFEIHKILLWWSNNFDAYLCKFKM